MHCEVSQMPPDEIIAVGAGHFLTLIYYVACGYSHPVSRTPLSRNIKWGKFHVSETTCVIVDILNKPDCFVVLIAPFGTKLSVL